MTKVVPAFIDPPGPYAPTQEWRDYRDELRRSDLKITALSSDDRRGY